LTGILAPAICPLLNVVGTRAIWKAPSEVGLIAICSLALIASTYPRVDTPHLTNVFAPTIAVSAWLLNRWRFRTYVVAIICCATTMLLSHTIQTRMQSEKRDTRSGSVRGKASELNALTLAQAAVPAGSSLFVYPYLPMMYFATAGVNPTQYSFLQPGMMSDKDEVRVLERLKVNPPEYVLFLLIEPEDLLRIWPNSDRRRVRMPALEGWIQANYTPDFPAKFINSYRLYRRAVPAK
jgi:hypothetical protein